MTDAKKMLYDTCDLQALISVLKSISSFRQYSILDGSYHHNDNADEYLEARLEETKKRLLEDTSVIFMNWVYEQAYQNKFWFYRFSEDGLSMTILNRMKITKQANGTLKVYALKKAGSVQLGECMVMDDAVESVTLLGKTCISDFRFRLFNGLFDSLKNDWVDAHDLSGFSDEDQDKLKDEIRVGIKEKAHGKLIHTLFGMPFHVLSKTCYKAIYDWIDKDTLKYTSLLSTSFYVNDTHYNFVVENREALDEIQAIAPGMLPIVFSMKTANLQVIKHKLMDEHSLTEAGWRWLVKQKRSILKALSNCYWSGGVCAMANILSAANIREPQFYLFAKSLGKYGLLGFHYVINADKAYMKQYNRLLRVVFEQAEVARKQGRIKNFVRDEVAFLMDWLGGTRGVLPNGDFNWKGLKTRQEAWHEEQAKIEQAKNPIGWKSLIDSETFEDIKITVTALNSAQALVDEGRALHHCVGSFVGRCRDGDSRIFSVRDMRGKASATLELVNQNGHWAIGQVRSYCNSNPTDACHKACEKFLKLYNQMWRSMDEGQREESLKWFRTDEVEVKPLAQLPFEDYAEDVTFALAA